MILAPYDSGLDPAGAGTLEAISTDGELLQALQRACAVVVYTPYGGVVEANSRFCEVFRYGADQVRRLDHARLVGDGPSWTHLLHDLQAGRTCHVRLTRRGARGARQVIQAVYTPILARGELVKVIEVGLPVDEVPSGLPPVGELRAMARAWLDDVLDAERVLLDFGRVAHGARQMSFTAAMEGPRASEHRTAVTRMREVAGEAQRAISSLRVLLRASGRRAENLVDFLETGEVPDGVQSGTPNR